MNNNEQQYVRCHCIGCKSIDTAGIRSAYSRISVRKNLISETQHYFSCRGYDIVRTNKIIGTGSNKANAEMPASERRYTIKSRMERWHNDYDYIQSCVSPSMTIDEILALPKRLDKLLMVM